MQAANPTARTPLTAAMLPFAVDGLSKLNTSANVIGCVAYQPPADQFGLNLDTFAFTVSDGQLPSPPLSVPVDVYVVYSPPAVVPYTVSTVGDKSVAVRLGVVDEFNTPNRTYVTRVLRMPPRGTLLNADYTPIVADANNRFWLSNPFEAVFLPAFNESGSPYTSFDIEVFDQELMNVPSAAAFQTLKFGTQSELGTCTIFRPSTGLVTITLDVAPVNHVPELATTEFAARENTLLTMTLLATDVDNDAITMYLRALPQKGYLYRVAPPAIGAACGALPNYGTPLGSGDLNSPIAPDQGTRNQFTLYYYGALNDYGLDYASVQAVFYDLPAADPSQLPAYQTDTISIDVEHVNQPPMLWLNDVSLSGDQAPTVVSGFGRFNFSTHDADLAGGLLQITIECAACEIDFNKTQAQTGSLINATTQSATRVVFVARESDANVVLSNLRINSAATTVDQLQHMVTVTVDDQGQNGAANTRCSNGSAVTGRVQITTSERASYVAAISGAAAGGVAIAAVAGAAVAAGAWLAARRTNILDSAAVPFEDEYSAGTTVSPIYQAGAVGGENPIMQSKGAIGGDL